MLWLKQSILKILSILLMGFFLYQPISGLAIEKDEWKREKEESRTEIEEETEKLEEKHYHLLFGGLLSDNEFLPINKGFGVLLVQLFAGKNLRTSKTPIFILFSCLKIDFC